MGTWRIIKSHEDYEVAMARLLALADTDLKEGTDDFDEFELLSLLIGHYEDSHYPIDKPTPIEAIKFRMDQMGLTYADMRQYLGSASKVSEVLSGKRKLSLSMIRRLHNGLGIPADILIQNSDEVEWSAVSFGVETLAIAFSDVCKQPSEVTGFGGIASLGVVLEVTTQQQVMDTFSSIKVNPASPVAPIECY